MLDNSNLSRSKKDDCGAPATDGFRSNTLNYRVIQTRFSLKVPRCEIQCFYISQQNHTWWVSVHISGERRAAAEPHRKTNRKVVVDHESIELSCSPESHSRSRDTRIFTRSITPLHHVTAYSSQRFTARTQSGESYLRPETRGLKECALFHTTASYDKCDRSMSQCGN